MVTILDGMAMGTTLIGMVVVIMAIIHIGTIMVPTMDITVVEETPTTITIPVIMAEDLLLEVQEVELNQITSFQEA